MFNKIHASLLLYFSIALLLAPIGILELDSFYYWDWSRHLALSYYDGSPMIAYFIKLSTLLFGNTLFAISFVGIIVAAATAFIIYKTGRLFLNKEASYVAMLMWLLSPLVTQDILYQTTYDTPLTLFWASTIYFLVKYLKDNETKNLYFCGASIGLMMMSKYSGIVLVLALFIFLITTSYRKLFKSRHVYLAGLLALVIFSPVILWNYQHEWQSFLYQLTTHDMGHPHGLFITLFKLFFRAYVPWLNILLIPPIFYCFKKCPKSLVAYLCVVICLTVIFFYLFEGRNVNIRKYWLTQYLISGALLGGFCFQQFNETFRKLTYYSIAVFGIFSLFILITTSFPLPHKESRQLVYYHSIQELNAAIPQLPETIVTASWYEARMVFFLKNKPQIYTLECGVPQNQYRLWSTKVSQEIINKTIKKALYIDITDRSRCMEQYFDHCERVWRKVYRRPHREYALYASICTNKDKSA
jgi:4-amino-4-deoxy-L-arabinose transferase-like glycosyltransferase